MGFTGLVCGKIRRNTRIHVLFIWRYSSNLGLGLPPRNSPFYFRLLDLRYWVGLGRVISSSQGLYLYTNTDKRTYTNIHALSGIRTHDPGFRAKTVHALDRSAVVTGRTFVSLDKNIAQCSFRVFVIQIIQII
jgi:hypothetical protein